MWIRIGIFSVLFMALFLTEGFSGTDRPKMQDQVTRLEGEVDHLQAKLQLLENKLQRSVDIQESGSLSRQESAENSLKIERIRKEIMATSQDLDVKINELKEARAKLAPEPESYEHYHPRTKPPKIKYDFKK